MSVEVHNVVAGKSRGGEPFDVVDPADFATVVGVAHSADAATVSEALEAAASAARAWGRLPLEKRTDMVSEAVGAALGGALGGEKVQGLATLLTREQGKVVAESTAEMSHSAALADLLGALAQQALAHDVLQDELGRRIRGYMPIGPVAAITPWNWPVVLAMIKVISALLTGNPVILKPPPTSPLTITRIIADMAAVLPTGVVAALNGGPDVGAALTASPVIRKVAFTGSSPNGRKVYAASAVNLKSLTLELGGNDAAVLLDDVDLDAALPRLLSASFVTAGQVCWAVKRVYVPASRYRETTEAICRAVDEFVLGSGLDPEVTLGPLNNRAQLDIVASLVRRAREEGAEVTELGRFAAAADPDGGFFHRPTVVTNVGNDAAIVQEEQFGPVLPLIAYEDEAEAVQWANGTEYGLSASVWSSDTERAFNVADLLEAGQVFVNCHGGPALDFTVGNGGIKQSGIGRELGVEGLREYLEAKLITSRVFG